MNICPRCAEPAAVGQEYCLDCGFRLGAPGLVTVREPASGWVLRTAAAGVMTKLLATCGVCAKQVSLRATRSTARGDVCEACATELPPGDGEEGGATADEEDEYVVPTNGCLWGFVCEVGLALGKIVLSVPKCPSCGCRQSSHCRC